MFSAIRAMSFAVQDCYFYLSLPETQVASVLLLLIWRSLNMNYCSLRINLRAMIKLMTIRYYSILVSMQLFSKYALVSH